MSRRHVVIWFRAGLVMAGGFAPVSARAEEPAPAIETASVGEERSEATAVPAGALRHEVLLSQGRGVHDGETGAERLAKGPPPAVAELPGAGPDKPGAQWVGGYWEWNKARRDYVWVTGTWQVPPTGKFWVNGYWRRDGRGWYRVAGFWSARVDDEAERQFDWRKDGPPIAPVEDVGPAPGPNHFYVSGVYTLDAERRDLVWKPGFWSPAHVGWDWIPTRWIRQSSEWAFREGSWQRIDPARDEAAQQSNVSSTSIPPGYPGSVPSFPPRYGYGPRWGSFMGRVGGFVNQVRP